MRKEVLVNNRKARPTTRDRRRFAREFDIQPTRRSMAAIEFEQRIVDETLALDRILIAKLNDELKELKAAVKDSGVNALKRYHGRVLKASGKLEAAQMRYNRRILIARACGFTPKVYRGRA